MKFSPILILILLCLDFQSVTASSTYEWGDTLHVWATSGLNMREGPGTDFPKIKKLEYGEQVKVIDDYLRSTPLSITVIKKSKDSDAFVMKGHWVRVLIGTQEGYVFDGYLSRLPVLKIEQKNTKNSKNSKNSKNTYQVKEGVLSYIERNFKKIDEKKMGDFENGEEDHNHIISYSNGFEFFSGGNKACGWEGFKIKDISLNEAFLIFSIIYNLEFNAKNNLEFNFKYELDTEGVIFINLFIGDIEDIYFEYHNNSVNIYLEGCC